MKAIIINSVCKYGSTGAIAYNLHRFLENKEHESIICYGRGKKYPKEKKLVKIDTDPEVYIHAVLARFTGLQGYFSNFATSRLLSIIKEFKPDVVYLQNLHGYYVNEFRLLQYLKKSNIFTVYLMPDEYAFMGKCCYSYDCERYKTGCNRCPHLRDYPKSLIFDTSKLLFNRKKSLYGMWKNIIFATVPYIVDKCKESKINKENLFFKIDTGIDLHGKYYIRDSRILRQRLNIPDGNKVVLNIGSLSSRRKGIWYFIEAANRLTDEKITFVNVGFDGDSSICPKNFIPISYVNDQDELAEYYSMADLLVCTSIADAMPNVCLQALACGTPVCGFNISGVPYVASEEFGQFVMPFDIGELACAILKAPLKTARRSDECRAYAESRYSNELFLETLEKLGVSKGASVRIGLA